MNSEHTITQLYQMIEDVQGQLERVQQLLKDLGPVDEQAAVKAKAEYAGSVSAHSRDVIVEGVFDGQHMLGPDGKVYTVPANYASKSKLVEGDVMKLTIKENGAFLYKQIGPVERSHEMGALIHDEQGLYRAVTSAGKSYKLLTASVTYYKGQPGDSVTMLVPKGGRGSWAAVETIISGAAIPVAISNPAAVSAPITVSAPTPIVASTPAAPVITNDPRVSFLDAIDELSTEELALGDIATPKP